MKWIFGLAYAWVASACFGQNTPERFEDWGVTSIDADTVVAATGNDAGEIFGVTCLVDGCYMLYADDSDCSLNTSQPALLNLQNSAIPVMLRCMTDGSSPYRRIDLTEDIYQSYATGGVLGIAYPIEAGEFRVSRFH